MIKLPVNPPDDCFNVTNEQRIKIVNEVLQSKPLKDYRMHILACELGCDMKENSELHNCFNLFKDQ